MATARPPLVTDHWFREGPGLPDGSDGYWICGICGGHRGDHVQTAGAWRKPLHAFVLQRNFPSHCRTCGRRRRHTVHAPLWWATVKTPTPGRPEEER